MTIEEVISVTTAEREAGGVPGCWAEAAHQSPAVNSWHAQIVIRNRPALRFMSGRAVCTLRFRA